MKSSSKIIFLVSVFLFPTLASAGCLGTDTLGGWKLYFGFPPGWKACNISVWFNGEISGGSCVDSSGSVQPVSGGRFSVNRDCDISGRVTTTAGSTILQDGRMNLTKLNVDGVAENEIQIRGMFSAVRK